MSGFSLERLDEELAGRITAAREGLVQVRCGRSGTGSGVVVHGDGLIITNAHVVRRQAVDVVLPDGEAAAARLLAYDEGVDLAALVVDLGRARRPPLPSLPLGDSRMLRPGSFVVAVGHPWGVTGAATAGMVIGVGQAPELLPYGGELIQVGLQLRPGHSGGPMLNAAGEVVGINTMIAGPLVGLAIPSAVVSRFLKGNFGSQCRRPVRKKRMLPVPA